MFAIEPDDIRRMTFANIGQSSLRLIAARPVQVCTSCSLGGTVPAPILRSQLLGWRITCPLCGNQLRDVGEHEILCPFRQYRVAALRGEKLLDDEAHHGIRTWASPAGIVRLLLMRRAVLPFLGEEEMWRFRVLGKIIPELDELLPEICSSFPTPQSSAISAPCPSSRYRDGAFRWSRNALHAAPVHVRFAPAPLRPGSNAVLCQRSPQKTLNTDALNLRIWTLPFSN